MKGIYGLYPDGHAAQQAVNRLRAAGFTDDRITVVSSYPMEAFEFGHIGKANRLWWVACGGGLVGMALGSTLLWIGETSWPMNVGGLPVWAWWPNLIIIFELTMLGAILATVGTLIGTARLGRRMGLYDPAVSDGQILVGVENPGDEALLSLQVALEAPPGARVKAI